MGSKNGYLSIKPSFIDTEAGSQLVCFEWGVQIVTGEADCPVPATSVYEGILFPDTPEAAGLRMSAFLAVSMKGRRLRICAPSVIEWDQGSVAAHIKGRDPQGG
jgi:hypothetical protein